MLADLKAAIAEKAKLRAAGLERRRALPKAAELSERILARLVTLPEYQRAKTFLIYLHVPGEVETQSFVGRILEENAGEKRLAVPYCVGSCLAAFDMRSFDELAPSRFGLLEPRREMRPLTERHIEPHEIDLLVMPGVVFDRFGGRIGHGGGFFDSFLRRVRPSTPRVALAFECQMIDRVPMLPHDQRVHLVVTERATYDCREAQ